MLKSFRADNFRGLESVVLSNLARVNLVTGLNNVGKTAILEALLLHAGGPAASASLNLFGALRGRVATVQGTELLLGAAPWDWLFPNHDTELVITTSADHTDVGPIVVRLRTALEPPGIDSVSGPPSASTEDGFLHGRNSLKVTVKLPGPRETTYTTSFVVLETAFGRQVGAKTDPQPQAPLISASIFSPRIHSNQLELATRYSDLVRADQAGWLLRDLRSVEPRLQELLLLTDLYGTELHLATGPNGSRRLLPLSLSGDGMTQIAEYLLAMVANPGGLLLVDEFGSGIHHTRLENLWRAVDQASSASRTQVVVTTHSQECISAALRVFGSDRESLRLYRLVRDEATRQIEAVTYDVDTLEGASELGLDVR